MLFWLDQIRFDRTNRCFTKLNLNQMESKEIVKKLLCFM